MLPPYDDRFKTELSIYTVYRLRSISSSRELLPIDTVRAYSLRHALQTVIGCPIQYTNAKAATSDDYTGRATLFHRDSHGESLYYVEKTEKLDL